MWCNEMRHPVDASWIQTQWKFDSHSWHCSPNQFASPSNLDPEKTVCHFNHSVSSLQLWPLMTTYSRLFRQCMKTYRAGRGSPTSTRSPTRCCIRPLSSLFPAPLCHVVFVLVMEAAWPSQHMAPSMYRRVNLCTHPEAKAQPLVTGKAP